MKESLKSATADDFRRRYQGCYGFYLGEEKKPQKIIVKIAAVDKNGMTFLDDKGAAYYAAADQNVLFEFLPATKSLFEVDGQIHYVYRHAARQWQRGISDQNTHVITMSNGRRINVTFKHLEVAFNPKPITIDVNKLAKVIAGTESSILLSKLFAIVQNKLYIYNVHIGNVKKDTISLFDSLYKTELNDLVVSQNLPFKIEVADGN